MHICVCFFFEATLLRGFKGNRLFLTKQIPQKMRHWVKLGLLFYTGRLLDLMRVAFLTGLTGDGHFFSLRSQPQTAGVSRRFMFSLEGPFHHDQNTQERPAHAILVCPKRSPAPSSLQLEPACSFSVSRPRQRSWRI